MSEQRLRGPRGFGAGRSARAPWMLVVGLVVGLGVWPRPSWADPRAQASDAASIPTPDALKFVDPMIGTAGPGHTFPAATVPFGMVQLGPDTDVQGTDATAGYRHRAPSLFGFSHTHLSGTGIGDMLDVLVVPMVGTLRTEPGDDKVPGSGYRARFRSEDEHARPGQYTVTLPDAHIKVELTATERAGLHRYTFPASEVAHVLIDLVHMRMTDPKYHCRVIDAEITIVNDQLITGWRRVDRFARDRHIYFAARFSRPFRASGVVVGADVQAGVAHARGTRIKAFATFSPAEAPLVLAVGLSGVDVAGAMKNLASEVPDDGFDAYRDRARLAWQAALGVVRFDGGTPAQKRIASTALYHTMLAPTLFDDVDGRYRGMDGAVHPGRGPGHRNFSTFSLWDTFRAEHPLLTLIAPALAAELADCLSQMAAESPKRLAPIWPLAGNETSCMIGYHSAVVISEAVSKHLPTIDVASSYDRLKHHALMTGYDGLDDYARLGWVPSDRWSESVSRTMEYAYDDWSLARLAHAAGKDDDCRLFVRRASGWKAVFDPKLAIVRPRLANGDWAEPFDPDGSGASARWADFSEANARQYLWAVPHDPAALIAALGGDQSFVDKLERHFRTPMPAGKLIPEFIQGQVGTYIHGNEPGHHVPYLFTYAGAPERTAYWVGRILDSLYTDADDGLPGNDDCGQLSAWYVFSALGLYPVDPASTNYVLGTPLFERSFVSLGGKRQLVIRAVRAHPADRYVQSVTWRGARLERTWISHQELSQGGELRFVLGARPGSRWGKALAARPPSMDAATACRD